MSNKGQCQTCPRFWCREHPYEFTALYLWTVIALTGFRMPPVTYPPTRPGNNNTCVMFSNIEAFLCVWSTRTDEILWRWRTRTNCNEGSQTMDHVWWAELKIIIMRHIYGTFQKSSLGVEDFSGAPILPFIVLPDFANHPDVAKI